LNVGDETWIYHGRWRNVNYPSDEALDYWAEVALATMPRDRWGAIGVVDPKDPTAQGSAWTAPITLPAGDCEFLINATGTTHIQVEIADERFNRFPENSGANAGKSIGPDGLECPVSWAKRDLSKLAGKTVRFQLLFSKKEGIDPRLYAIYLRKKN
jgi:hypothetical protein